MAAFGQEWSLTEPMHKGRFGIGKPTFEPIAAAQYDRFVGYVRFGMLKRMWLVDTDFVAL